MLFNIDAVDRDSQSINIPLPNHTPRLSGSRNVTKKVFST